MIPSDNLAISPPSTQVAHDEISSPASSFGSFCFMNVQASNIKSRGSAPIHVNITNPIFPAIPEVFEVRLAENSTHLIGDPKNDTL